MKRVLNWIEEEHVILLILLLTIGIILSTLPDITLFSGLIFYGVITLSLLKAGHSLYLKFKR